MRCSPLVPEDERKKWAEMAAEVARYCIECNGSGEVWSCPDGDGWPCEYCYEKPCPKCVEPKLDNNSQIGNEDA